MIVHFEKSRKSKKRINLHKIMKKLINKIVFRIYFGKTKNTVDELDYIDKYLKKKGYIKYGNIYTKGFIVIEIKLKSKEIDSIEIFIDGISKNKQIISENFTTGLIISENYFSRL